ARGVAERLRDTRHLLRPLAGREQADDERRGDQRQERVQPEHDDAADHDREPDGENEKRVPGTHSARSRYILTADLAPGGMDDPVPNRSGTRARERRPPARDRP